MKTFFIADTHFGHEAIIKYENRPFENASDMDKILIENWNNVVAKDDKVYLLGDISFYNAEKTKKTVKQLKGNKHLIIGNHDNLSVKRYYEMGFQRVYDLPVIYKDFFILSHAPIYMNTNMPYANFFGHVHGDKAYTDFSNQSFCVSAERINYTPIEFSEMLNKMGVVLD